MKHILFTFLSLIVLGPSIVNAQEFKANITINAPRLQNADKNSLETLKSQIEEFYNNISFTDLVLQDEEKIEFNLTIFIKEDLSATNFSADFLFQSLRPVFDSDYTSAVMNTIDKDFRFTYTDLQPIQNNEASYTDVLSSLLTFYAYIILGQDFDTFSPFGGEPYFLIAQNVLNNVPSSVKDADNSWSAEGPARSRYYLISDIMNPKARDVRQAMYEYHRQGLDIMSKDPDKGLVIVLNALTNLNQVNEIFPNSQIVQMFTDAKRDEIIQIMKGGVSGQKTKAYNIMVKLDPARADKYQAINQI